MTSLGLWSVRLVQGVVQKLTSHSLELADPFKHPKSNNESVPCEASVLNAFSKVEITRDDLS